MAGRHNSRNATRALYLRPGATTRVAATRRAIVLFSMTALLLGLVGAVSPSAAASEPGAVAVDAGTSHTCGIRTDQTLECWGNNGSGQAADQTGTWTAVSAGGSHTCGIRSDATLECWGFEGNGQAADQTGTWTAVSAGTNHTCGISGGGTPACWGNDVSGQSTIPGGAPDTAIDSGPAGTTTATDATFEFSASESDASFECRLDGAPSFTECASGQEYTGLAAGAHLFRVRAVSRWGFRDFSPDRWSWTITSDDETPPTDTTDPETTNTSGPDNGTMTPDPNPVFTFSSTEEGSTFACALDGAQPTACTSAFTATGLSDGAHTFSVTATDAAGNADDTPAEWSFSVLAPTCGGERATRVIQDDGFLGGTSGSDVLVGLGPNDQVLRSGGGSDIVCAGGGDDLAVGGSNDDTLFGQRGDDVLRGGSGGDILNGGLEMDVCNGGSGTNDSATVSCERKVAIP